MFKVNEIGKGEDIVHGRSSYHARKTGVLSDYRRVERVEREYQDKIYPVIRYPFSMLPEAAKEVLVRIGITPGLLELSKSEKLDIEFLLRIQIPLIAEAYGADYVAKNWNELLEQIMIFGENVDSYNRNRICFSQE